MSSLLEDITSLTRYLTFFIKGTCPLITQELALPEGLKVDSKKISNFIDGKRFEQSQIQTRIRIRMKTLRALIQQYYVDAGFKVFIFTDTDIEKQFGLRVMEDGKNIFKIICYREESCIARIILIEGT